MTKIIVHGTTFSGNIAIVFDFDARLKSIAFDCEMAEEIQQRFLNRLPITEQSFMAWVKKNQIKHTIIPADLSFTAFWLAYNYKVGNKQRAEKLWNALSDEEKSKSFVSIPKYDFYMKMHPKLERLYPETYLFQRRFENEYR